MAAVVCGPAGCSNVVPTCAFRRDPNISADQYVLDTHLTSHELMDDLTEDQFDAILVRHYRYLKRGEQGTHDRVNLLDLSEGEREHVAAQNQRAGTMLQQHAAALEAEGAMRKAQQAR